MRGVRWGLTVLLLMGVYDETGPWTTITLGLMALTFEVMSWRLREGMEGGTR